MCQNYHSCVFLLNVFLPRLCERAITKVVMTFLSVIAKNKVLQSKTCGFLNIVANGKWGVAVNWLPSAFQSKVLRLEDQ